jgi:hypothetical protein
LPFFISHFYFSSKKFFYAAVYLLLSNFLPLVVRLPLNL